MDSSQDTTSAGPHSSRQRIPVAAAAALGISEMPSDGELTAALLALDEPSGPLRPETERTLATLTHSAFRAMPGADIPWDSAQYLHAATYPLREPDGELSDDLILAIVAADLGLLKIRPTYSLEWWTPEHFLQENLEAKAKTLLSLLADRMIDAGAIPDWSGARRHQE